MKNKHIVFTCKCGNLVDFELHDPVLNDDDEKLKVQVWHNQELLYIAKLGGVGFTEKADELGVAYTLLSNILKTAKDEPLDGGCLAMFTNAAFVLGQLILEKKAYS